MEILIVRHAPAVPQNSPDLRDEDRSLTPEGEAKFRLAARGLARLLKAPETILTSPLKRARQTAEIAAEAWGGAAPVPAPALAGSDVEAIARLLARQTPEARVALFGHEPTVSALLALLLGVRTADALAFKKGAAALVETSDPRQPGSGRLVWFATPALLRALGGED